MDRARELLRERGRRRRGHQVDLRDQRLLGRQLLRRAPHQRRLAEAAQREDDDVLPVANVGLELGDLRLAVGERLIERERAVAEGVGAGHYAGQRNADLRKARVQGIVVGDISASSSYQESA